MDLYIYLPTDTWYNLKVSDYNVELELDLAVYELNKFIALVNKTSTIRDLSVDEPEIGEVIKVLYQTGK